MAVSIEIKNFGVIRDLAGNFPKLAAVHVTKAIGLSLSAIQGAAKVEAPFGVSSLLRNNWAQDVRPIEGSLRNRQEYATDVHEGTPPHYVSPKELAKWAEKKGLNPYAVSKSIARKGTRANPFLSRAVGRTETRVNEFFGKAADSITDDLSRGDGKTAKL